jgi:hypothetical protein
MKVNGHTLGEREYSKRLREVVDLIVQIAQIVDWSWTELATESGLCSSTVYNLLNGVTRLPRFKTVLALAYATGTELYLFNRLAKGKKKAG